MTRQTNTMKILKELLAGKELTASDNFASNTNQYFRTIKLHGIELEEVWMSNVSNSGRHKVRSLVDTKENISRAKQYLKQLRGRLTCK